MPTRDAGMISEANQIALAAAGLTYVLGSRIPQLPSVVTEWQKKHPGSRKVPRSCLLVHPTRGPEIPEPLLGF